MKVCASTINCPQAV